MNRVGFFPTFMDGASLTCPFADPYDDGNFGPRNCNFVVIVPNKWLCSGMLAVVAYDMHPFSLWFRSNCRGVRWEML